MLFNSYIFILVFLPSTLLAFSGLHHAGRYRLALATLAMASLIFYGWWSIKALGLLLVLTAANYAAVFTLLAKLPDSFRRTLVAVAIAGNLAVLGYFKYANFFLRIGQLCEVPSITVVLPLGLSFLAFQKIAVIVDGRYLNLVITMLLGGLWHGAAWTFVVWGALHAIYLSINHAWIALRRRMQWAEPVHPLSHLASCAITFTAVLVAWVFFRANDLSTAISILRAMAGFGANAQATPNLVALGAIATLLAVVWLTPNSTQIISYLYDLYFSDVPERAHSPVLRWAWAPICGCLLALCLMSLTRVSEFLYFQF